MLVLHGVVLCLLMGATVGAGQRLLIGEGPLPDLLADTGMMFLMIGFSGSRPKGGSISTEWTIPDGSWQGGTFSEFFLSAGSASLDFFIRSLLAAACSSS